MQVLCGQCGQSIVVEDSQAGQQVACPRCQHQVAIPRLDDMAAVETSADDSFFGNLPDEEGFAGQVKQAMSRKIQVACGSCGRGLSLSARMAGRKARCPACNTQILIPFPDEAEADAQIERLTSKSGRTHREPPPKPTPHAPAEEEPIPAVPVTPAPMPSAPAPPAQQGDSLAAAAAALESTAHYHQSDNAAPVPAGLAEAAADASEKRRRLARKVRGWGFYAFLLSFAALTIGVGVYLGTMLIGPKDTTEVAKTDGETKTEPSPGKSDNKTSQPTVPKTVAPTQPIKPPPIAVARMSVVATTAREFAAGGYHPARPGFVYWEVTAAIKAGPAPLTFRNFGSDATLKAASAQYASLGSPVESPGLPPPRGIKRSLSIAAGQGQTATFLFEVPADLAEATLKLPGLEEAAVRPVLPKPPVEVAGTYAEAAPRNLRPMLRDPVMAAIQSAPAHQLVVKEEAAGLTVAIPAAAVHGVAQPAGNGIMQAVLKNGSGELKCSLRPTRGGDGMILYLSDQPFHQITYAREGKSVSGGGDEGERPRRPRPVDEPKAGPKTEPKTEPKTTKSGKGGSIFDEPDPVEDRPSAKPAPSTEESQPATRPSFRNPGRKSIFDY